ncbi:uncharacterized protein LOC144672700 isoform X2 [Cetorhinus maximus]
MAAATVRGASDSIVPRNECLTQKARPIKPTVANKENRPRLVRPEKGPAMSGSRLPIPVKKLKIKSVPDFKKLHQNWDQKFQKKQAIAKKACTQPVPFNFGTSRGSKSTPLMSTDQNIQVISVVTRKESAESEESYPVHAKCVMAAKDQAAVESKPTQNPAHQECRDLAPSIATLKLDQSEVVNKENYFVPWQANATPSKTKSFYIQSSAPEIKLPSPPEKAKIEIVQNENIKPNTGNSDEDFESNPIALQSILSNVGINAFNVINGKLSLAHTLSMKTNVQNYKPSNLNPGNNDGMALRNAPSTLDDENTFSNPSGKPSMAMRAPVKDNALHCKYPAQSPYVMGRSSYMPCNRPTLPLAWGRASCIAKLGTRGTGTEISSPSSILQPIKLYNQVSSRQHFSAQKSARCKPDGLDFNLMDRACESYSSVASTFVSAGGPGTLKPDAKDLEMQTPNRVLRPPNHHFSSTRAPSSQNLWHPRYMPAPPTSVDQIVLRLFNDSEDPNEVEKATETPSLKEELERPKSKQDPSLVDLKLVKLKNIELLSQQLQKEMQEVKVIEETLIENGCEANAPVFLEEHLNLAGAVLKSRPIATALKQQEAEEHVLPSHCTALTSKPALKPVDCSIQTNSVSGAVNSFPTIACQSEMLLPSTELALNMMDTLPTPIFHSSSRLYTTAQGLKFQSPFCSGSRDRSTLLWTSMKQRFSQVLPGCRKPSQEAFLDEEVSCCLAHAFQSPEKRINRERNCTNPVAKILEQQEVMHFVPIELHHQPEVSPTTISVVCL